MPWLLYYYLSEWSYYEDYQNHMLSVQNAINEILINLSSGKQANTADLKKKLTLLLELLRT